MTDIEQILAECYNSSKKAAKVFFPDRFHRPFDAVHDQVFDLLDNSKNPRKLILAPRGMGKTSISNLLIPAKKSLFLDKHYIVPVSASATGAKEQSENLKREMLGNEVINEFFDVNKTNTFSQDKWIVDISGHQVCFQPRGAGQHVRGMLFKNSRPDLVIVDDLEDDELVQSEERRKKLKEWFFGALMNIVDRGTDDWEIIVIGTLLHEDSLLMNLSEDPSWDSITIEICDDNYNSNAPNLMSSEEIRELAEQYRDSGEIDVFYREYRNIPISTEDSSFQKEHFQYFIPGDVNFNGPNIDTLIIIDPAKTAKIESADSALVGVSIDMEHNKIYVRDIVAGKFHPDQIMDEMIGMITRLNAKVVGVEVTGLNEFVTYPIKNHLFRSARHVELVELHARGGVTEKGKVARVRSLVPFYRQGLVYHNKACCSGLEAQLLSFPRSKRWDIMDALGYAVEMLEIGQRYMMSSDDRMATREEVEAEFEELDEWERLPEIDFRIV